MENEKWTSRLSSSNDDEIDSALTQIGKNKLREFQSEVVLYTPAVK
ncbi:MAG: hypothetical protein ACXVPY_07935 [Bacteroidia bacterium]